MKVAEGSYGEVFMLAKRTRDALEASPVTMKDPNRNGGCIFKLIPLRSKTSRSTKQTSLEALVREVQMLKRMDAVPGFARFREVTVLQGEYPPSFTQAYNALKEKTAGDSFAANPSTYPEKQLWAMIEMDDGGRDLETLKRPSAYQVFDIFWLTCCALSYAEEYADFEVHRRAIWVLANARLTQYLASRPARQQYMHQVQQS
jgi:serine/threonine-protein kinase haspin